MKFVIPITPTAQERDRLGLMYLRDPKTGAVKPKARSYKADTQVEKEEAIKALLRKHVPKTPLTAPLLLGVKAFFNPPKEKPGWFTGTASEYRECVALNILRPPVTPDADNLLKQIQDCMTQCAFWKDDNLVIGYLPGTGKYYTLGTPRWEIEVAPYSWEKAYRAKSGRLSLLEHV